MSDSPCGDTGQPIKQSTDGLSGVMENLLVTSNNSDKTSTPKNLSDMPVDVVGLIIERSDNKERLILRKVSKSLRALVDKQKPACQSVYFYVSDDRFTLWFDNQKVVYTQSVLPLLVLKIKLENGIIVVRDDFEKVALDDLTSTLKNPKLQLEKFEFGYDRLDGPSFIERAHKKINKQLKSINCQISAKNHTVRDVSDLPTILPYLKPEALKTITICFDQEERSWNYGAALKAMEQVESLEQWKNVEEFIVGIPFEDFPMRYARHFKRFIIKQNAISNGLLLRMRDYFSKCKNFEACVVYHDHESIDEAIGNELGVPVASDERIVIHYSIPDSEHYLEFKFRQHNVTIEKKKKQF